MKHFFVIKNNPLFYSFLCFAIIAVLSICNGYYIRMDIAETFFLGNDMKLFYPKHPPFSFWVSGVILKIINHRDIYVVAGVVSCFLYFVNSVVGYFLARQIFSKPHEKILHCVVLFSLTMAFFLKRVELTPDLYFNTIATLFIVSTYFLVKNGKWHNFAAAVVLGWLLVLTKHQAILVFAASFLPFVLTKEGRKVAFKLKFLFVIVVFALPVSLFYYYHIIMGASDVKYVIDGKPNFNYFKILKIILNVLIRFNLLVVMLILFSKSARMTIVKSISLALNKIKNYDFNGVFLTCNTLGFIVFLTVSIYILKPDGMTRYIYSNIVPIICFGIFLLRRSILKINDYKYLKNVVISALCVTMLFVLIQDISRNNNGRGRMYKNMVHHFERQTNVDFETVVWWGREFDRAYPYFTKKLKVIEDTASSEKDMAFLQDKNFLLLSGDSGMHLLEKYKTLFPNHKLIVMQPFEESTGMHHVQANAYLFVMK